MTKREFLEQIADFPDDAILMVETDLVPAEVENFDEGSIVSNGKVRRVIIIQIPESAD